MRSALSSGFAAGPSHAPSNGAGYGAPARVGAYFLVVVILLGGQQSASGSPGGLVDVGGFRLQIDCSGSGRPAVVLDAGLGGSAHDWLAVKTGLADSARVCTYDRAGYGKSDPGPPPRTSSRIASELRSLLARAPIPGPYLLVGHSFGGYNMRLFASMFPTDTRGIVLVDTPHEDQAEGLFQSEVMRRIDPRGLLRNLWNSPVLYALSALDLRPFTEPSGIEGKTLVAILGEVSAFTESSAEVHGAEIPLHVPLVVVMHGRRVLPPGTLGDQLEEQWLALQRDLARRHPKSRFIVAPEGAHNIPVEQPQIVIDTIRSLIAGG